MLLLSMPLLMHVALCLRLRNASASWVSRGKLDREWRQFRDPSAQLPICLDRGGMSRCVMFHKLVRWNAAGIAKWERTRCAGRKRYVWRIGVLGWGSLMFLVMTPYLYFQAYGSTWPSFTNLPIALIAFSALAWLIAGYCFGSTMWSTMERSYEMHRRSMDPKPPA